MVKPKRLLALEALTERLKTITLSNGYGHDLSESVFRGVPVFSDGDPVPMVSILEWVDFNEVPQFLREVNKYKHTLDLMVQGWTEADDCHWTDTVYPLLADVQKCLSSVNNMDDKENYMLGRLITRLDLSPGMVRPPDQLSALPCFYLRVRIEVAEKLSDPYDLT